MKTSLWVNTEMEQRHVRNQSDGRQKLESGRRAESRIGEEAGPQEQS